MLPTKSKPNPYQNPFPFPNSDPKQAKNSPEKPILDLIPVPDPPGNPRKPPPHTPIRHPVKPALLRPPQRTNIFIWCCAFFCFIFSIFMIIGGILTLIVFLVIKPKHPSFDTTSASLNTIYLVSPELFNGDLTFLANFSNPNRKIDVRFEYSSLELYFGNRLIAAQYVEPFSQRRGETRLQAVHMISSEVYLPLDVALELQRQVRNNSVWYNIRGTFRVRASLGLSHFSYWLYGRCQIELSGPPNGVLVARSCRTKR